MLLLMQHTSQLVTPTSNIFKSQICSGQVGATVEEFEEVVDHEAEMDVMVEALVESEDEPLTNDPDAVGELLEVWDTVVDTSPVEGDFVDRYDGGGVM